MNRDAGDSVSEADKIALDKYREEMLGEIERDVEQAQAQMKRLRPGSKARAEAADEFRSLKEEQRQFKEMDWTELRIRLVYALAGYDGECDRLQARTEAELQMAMQYMKAGDVLNQNAMSAAAERDSRIALAWNKRVAHLLEFVKAMDQGPIRASARYILGNRKIQSEDMRQHLIEWAKE